MGQPFTGIVHGEARVFKGTSSILEFKDGLLNGKIITYWSSGEKLAEEDFLNGVRNGFAVRWHKNGQKQSEERYENDILVGEITEWDDKGEIARHYEPQTIGEQKDVRPTRRYASYNPKWKNEKIENGNIQGDAVFISKNIPILKSGPVSISELEIKEKQYGSIVLDIIVDAKGRVESVGPNYTIKSGNGSILKNKINRWIFAPLVIQKIPRRCFSSLIIDFDKRINKTYIRQTLPYGYRFKPIYCPAPVFSREIKNIDRVLNFAGETDIYGRIKKIYFETSFPQKLAKMSISTFKQWVIEPYIGSGIPKQCNFMATLDYKGKEMSDPVVNLYFFISK